MSTSFWNRNRKQCKKKQLIISSRVSTYVSSSDVPKACWCHLYRALKNVGAVAELSSIIGNFCDHHGVLSWLSQEMWLRPARMLEGVRNSFYFHATSGLSHTLLAGMQRLATWFNGATTSFVYRSSSPGDGKESCAFTHQFCIFLFFESHLSMLR